MFFTDAKIGLPARSHWLSPRIHIRLMRQLTSFACIAFHAGGHYVVPACFASFLPWNHVIKIEI